MVRRREIYWAEFTGGIGSEQRGRRPALIIQNDVGNRSSTTTIVALITSRTRSRSYPFHVTFTAEESGLRLAGIVMCEQVQTIEQSRLEALTGSLSSDKMQEVDIALHRSLGLEH